eukprot:CAMPEP_0195284580 /NCGR_PEP_ID=MMETSP0707-20130614/2730_1 /TAXON_ID=33640 /ORGANISM="Asterionellopsis glacialis, Strain CCMP134" /LENGTH=42 /DNA_ID= /DNA_START= /DNA_END= /DNA_ORIENTATION=
MDLYDDSIPGERERSPHVAQDSNPYPLESPDPYEEEYIDNNI